MMDIFNSNSKEEFTPWDQTLKKNVKTPILKDLEI
jgi:hypothetical protein